MQAGKITLTLSQPRKAPTWAAGKILRSISRAIDAQLLARWKVTIVWEGQTLTHWARSEGDALGWLACYPCDTSARVEHFPLFCGLSPLLAAGRNI